MKELAHKMFFNILLHNPDSCVYDFIKQRFPHLTEPVVKGEWIKYPHGRDNFPIITETIHSIIFKKHPFFKAKFSEGRLDILTQETKGYPPSPSDFILWFMFENKEDVENSFNELSAMFDSLSKSKKEKEINHRKILAYSSMETFDWMEAVEFVMTEDELYENKYKIMFRIAALTYLNE